jgi:beta-aspartyl-peptidase (threonine type)
MERTPHVLLVGADADRFAATHGLEQVDPEWFITPQRRQQWERRREKEQAPTPKPNTVRATGDAFPASAHGTVGAVALDQSGHLAAATSTGGLFGKLPGRVGDSPLIGAGTFADDATCAVSATGHGEFFIRWNVAHDIAARIRYRRANVRDAATEIIRHELPAVGGSGGVIVLDRLGRWAWPCSTKAMPRGRIGPDGEPDIRLLPDPPE